MKSVLFVGSLPPPIEGKAVATAAILSHIRRSFKPEVCVVEVTHRGLSPFKVVRIMQKLGLTICSLWGAFRARAGRRETIAYIVADGGAGIFITALQATLIRPLVSRIVVHHHGLKWMITKNNALKMLLFRQNDLHVTQCSVMSMYLRHTYNFVQTMSVSNAFLVSDAETVRHSPCKGRPFRLVHLSNLSIAKGLSTVIETFAVLKSRGADVTLRLGGEPTDKAALTCLKAALTDYPDIEHVGFVNNEGKAAFFTDTDAFLFPTMYEMETQGIVTLEALAHGVPVIAYDQCCLAEMLQAPSGVPIRSGTPFSAQAIPALTTWIENPNLHADARQHARLRFNALYKQSLVELDALTHVLIST